MMSLGGTQLKHDTYKKEEYCNIRKDLVLVNEHKASLVGEI